MWTAWTISTRLFSITVTHKIQTKSTPSYRRTYFISNRELEVLCNSQISLTLSNLNKSSLFGHCGLILSYKRTVSSESHQPRVSINIRYTVKGFYHGYVACKMVWATLFLPNFGQNSLKLDSVQEIPIKNSKQIREVRKYCQLSSLNVLKPFLWPLTTMAVISNEMSFSSFLTRELSPSSRFAIEVTSRPVIFFGLETVECPYKFSSAYPKYVFWQLRLRRVNSGLGSEVSS